VSEVNTSLARSEKFRKLFLVGGIVAAVVLTAFGIASLVIGATGVGTVRDSIAQEYISGTPDMTPAGIAEGVAGVRAAQTKIAAAQARAGIPEAARYSFTEVEAPTCSVAGKAVNTGERARCFAGYMRIHALESSSGLVYSQMGRFVSRPGAPPASTDFIGGTSDDKWALLDPTTQQPVSNGARNLWVTETALTTALNTSYFAERVALFSVIMGIALLLTGIGFGVLTLGALRHTLPAREESSAGVMLGGKAVAQA